MGRPARHPVRPVRAKITANRAKLMDDDRMLFNRERKIDEARSYLDELRTLRISDKGSAVVYTTPLTRFSNTSMYIMMGITKGVEFEQTGIDLITVEWDRDYTRWVFVDDAHAMMFKMKYGSEVIPAPWKEFFSE